jgi:hypothetical protein
MQMPAIGAASIRSFQTGMLITIIPAKDAHQHLFDHLLFDSSPEGRDANKGCPW